MAWHLPCPAPAKGEIALDVLKIFCGVRGRIRRGPYWLALIGLNVAIFILTRLWVGGSAPLSPLLIGMALALYLWLVIASCRARDAGWPGGAALMTLIPMAGLVIAIVLGCVGSEPGENDPPPSIEGRGR